MRWFAVGQEPMGVVAIGQAPTGVLAIGQLATGVVAIGQLARGFVAIGQLAVGVFAFGQLGVGAVWAGGMLAVGATTGLSLVGLGAVGYWLPWRPRSLRIQSTDDPWVGALRGLALVAIVALVIYVAAYPVTDVVLREGGLFRERRLR